MKTIPLMIVTFASMVVLCAAAPTLARDVPWATPPKSFDPEGLFPLHPPPDVETECRLADSSTYAFKHPEDGREKFADSSGTRNNPENFVNRTNKVDPSGWDYRVHLSVKSYKPYIKTWSFKRYPVITDYNVNPNVGFFWISSYIPATHLMNITRVFQSGLEVFTSQLDDHGSGDMMVYFNQAYDDRPSSSFRRLRCEQNWPEPTDWGENH